MLFCNTCFWGLLPESFKILNTDGQDSTSQHSVFEARAAMSMLMLLAVPMLLCMFFFVIIVDLCEHVMFFLYVVSTKPKSNCIMPVSTKLNVFPPRKRSPDNSEIMIIVHIHIYLCIFYVACGTLPFEQLVVGAKLIRFSYPLYLSQGAQWEPFSSPYFQGRVGATINGHILLVYVLGLCKGIYPQNMAKNMVQIW